MSQLEGVMPAKLERSRGRCHLFSVHCLDAVTLTLAIKYTAVHTHNIWGFKCISCSQHRIGILTETVVVIECREHNTALLCLCVPEVQSEYRGGAAEDGVSFLRNAQGLLFGCCWLCTIAKDA